MQIECGHCRQKISYEDSLPKFCSECGQSLSQSISTLSEDETIAKVATDLNRDVEADTIPPDQTKPISNEHVEAFNLESVGPYRLVRKLGQGGMGTVFEAVHMESGRHVALKLLSPAVRGTEEMVQRFRRESQIAASINHPRSTFVYEAGEHQEQLYITMELMGGGTLKEVVADEGPLPVGRSVDYVLDMIDGLIVAHNAGIVHRDLKPANSFVDADGRIKVGDFGLAKSFWGDSSLTQTGTFMGTPQFAAPEQMHSADVDERTDIYALGGTLFYLLTGRAPFVGNPAQVIASIASEPAPKVSEFAKGIPKPLVQLIAQTLEKDPERRPFNLSMLRDQLLPFSTRGALAADPGRRMAAFFFDLFAANLGSALLIMVVSPMTMFLLGAMGISMHPQILGMMIVLPATMAYFAIAENRWGRTLGKWMLGMRVVNRFAESPTLIKSIIRAALIPGLTILTNQLISFWLVDTQNIDVNEIMSITFKTQALGFLAWIPVLLMLSTARRENGYQGVHGILSGTRVVRLSADLESRLLKHSAVTVPAEYSCAEKMGTFEILGKFRDQGQEGVAYLGKDDELDRPVWVFGGFTTNPIPEDRKHLTRPSRLRIIAQDGQDPPTWYATESVPGLPLSDVLGDSSCNWQSFRPLIRDLANELALSQESGLIPAQVSLDHVWLDHTGQVRILDHVLAPSAQSVAQATSSDAASDHPDARAVNVLIRLLDQFMLCHEHPVDVMHLREELAARSGADDVLEWTVSRLNESTERLSTWNWVDRIGMLAISGGLELSSLTTLMFTTGFLMSLTRLGTMVQTCVAALAGVILITVFACFFNGGPAMHLSNVSVRRRDKRRASKFRTVLRSWIAWGPWIGFMAMMIYFIFNHLSGDIETLQISPAVQLNFTILSFLAMFINLVGMLIAIINPARGLPDFMSGTRLMRK